MTDQHGRVSADVQAMMAYDVSKKSTGVAYLLWFFLGSFGAPRIYTGRTGSAVGMIALNVIGWISLIFVVGIFLLGALGIWVLVDAFLIPGWLKQHNGRLASRLGMVQTMDFGDGPEPVVRSPADL